MTSVYWEECRRTYWMWNLISFSGGTNIHLFPMVRSYSVTVDYISIIANIAFLFQCSLQCRCFLWARKCFCSWKRHMMLKPKRGGNGANQRERGGGGEREEKTPAQKHCENEKHPLISCAWLLFQKWVANNNETTKQSFQSKDSHCLKKNKLEFIIVFVITESQCNSPQLMKLQFKLQFILLNSYF